MFGVVLSSDLTSVDALPPALRGAQLGVETPWEIQTRRPSRASDVCANQRHAAIFEGLNDQQLHRCSSPSW